MKPQFLPTVFKNNSIPMRPSEGIVLQKSIRYFKDLVVRLHVPCTFLDTMMLQCVQSTIPRHARECQYIQTLLETSVFVFKMSM